MPDKIKLPPESIASLQQSQRELIDILPEIDNAEACGVECQEYRRIHSEAMDRIEQLLARFGATSNRKR